MPLLGAKKKKAMLPMGLVLEWVPFICFEEFSLVQTVHLNVVYLVRACQLNPFSTIYCYRTGPAC